MKIRMTQNSIRIRVRKSELQTLQQNQIIGESVTFLDGTVLKFGLKIDKNSSIVGATMDQQGLFLFIPTKEAHQWIQTNQVGIESTINLADGEKLHLLIEKDFPCLDRENEDKSDTFWELAPDAPESC